MALKKQFSFDNGIVVNDCVARFERFELKRVDPTRPDIDVLFYKDEATMNANGEPVEQSRVTLTMDGFDPTNIKNQVHTWLLAQPEFSGGTVIGAGILKSITLPSGVVLASAVAKVTRLIIERTAPTTPIVEAAIYRDIDALNEGLDAIRHFQRAMTGFNPANARNQVYAWVQTLSRFTGAVVVPD